MEEEWNRSLPRRRAQIRREAVIWAVGGTFLFLFHAFSMFKYGYGFLNFEFDGALGYFISLGLPLSFLMCAVIAWRRSTFSRWEWNGRALKYHYLFLSRREFVWDDLKDITFRIPGGHVVFDFSDGRSVRFSMGSFDNFDDYEAVKELAEEKLRENARTS